MATQPKMKQGELILPGLVPPQGSDLRTVFRRIRNFLAGRFVGATRDEALLSEVLKCLYCRIHLDSHPELLEGRSLSAIAVSDGVTLSGLCRRVFRAIREENSELFSGTEELLLDPAALAYTIGALAEVCLIDGDRDAIGDAYEVFIGSHVRGQDGQFFTPRNAARFLIAATEPTVKSIVLDPACGAGGFLSATIQHLAKNGATADAIQRFSASRLYGIDKDKHLVSLTQAHIFLAAQAKPHVVCADSLAWNPQAGDTLDSFPGEGEYDIVLTNPPFGADIVAATGSVLRAYALARKWRHQPSNGHLAPTSDFQNNVPPQVLFVEKCVKLARPGGRIGIVLPESLISSKSHRYVIEFIRSECIIKAVAGMPESLFKTSGKGGTHTKTCLLVLQKRSTARRPSGGKLFMAEARWCGHDSRGKPIPHDDLPAIQANFASFTNGRLSESSPLGFAVVEEDIADNVLAPRYYDPEVSRGLNTLKKTHHLVRFGDLMDQGVLEVNTGDEIGKLAYGTGSIPFVRTSDLSNWEIKADPKHCVSRELYESYREAQDIRPGDILMVRDGTYLIGTCALVTSHDREILYQSHIYKIRVLKGDLGLNPYLLLAILSSEIVQQQIRAKRFTQDIIDSLGDRIAELILPIWKNAAHRNKITRMVTTAIETRIEAREASRRARELVAKG